MKKLLFIAIVAVSLGVNAQIEAGKLMISGSFGFNTTGGKTESTVTAGGTTTTTTTDNPKTFGFNLLPQVGFMLSENLGIGLGMGYEFSKTSWTQSFGGADRDMYSKSGTFYFAPFARYYKNTGEKAYAFGEFSMPIGVGSINSNSWDGTSNSLVDDDPTKTFSFGAHLSIGFNYFLNDKCALEAKWAALQFNSTSSKQEGTGYSNKSSDTYLGLGLDMTAFSVGLRIFI